MDEREKAIKQRDDLLTRELNERTRRLFAAAEARIIGRGGIAIVSRATGFSRKAIRLGIKQRQEEASIGSGRIRRVGGGRKKTVTKDQSLREDGERLVEPVTCGDPESPLRWTCKSVRTLAAERKRQGHQVSHQLVSELLPTLGDSFQANRKTHEGGEHPDRDAQFEPINTQAKAFLAQGEPVLSVDAKKKELVGDFKNPGQEWSPKGEPEEVRGDDCPIAGQGRVTPSGIYDQGRHTGWVKVGIDPDTAACAVERLRRWWNEVGHSQDPEARKLLVTADGGGSNGSRGRVWTGALQRLADETGLLITVCHFPPGTSTWNKSEHRLFSFISQNWRGKPLVSSEVILTLIAATRTRAGLTVESRLDPNISTLGRQISEKQMDTLSIRRDDVHGEWNSTILPRIA